MIVTDDALQKIDNHWAIRAIGESESQKGLKIANARLVKKAVGQQIQLDFSDNDSNDDLLRRLALAYEVAAIDGLDAFLKPTIQNAELRMQCVAGAWRAFELRRIFKLPEIEEEKIFHILHLSSLAYCGDRWSDLRRWYAENKEMILIPSVAKATWDQRLLYRLFECWLRLFRKDGWDDVDRIREIIAGLREDQKIYESDILKNNSNAKNQIVAFRLIALYHWAKAAELLAKYMLQGEPVDINTQLEKHFESSMNAAQAGKDARLEVLLRWLYAASRQMVSGSVWWVARAVNSRVTKFVREITKQQSLFELLPPQRTALQEQGLLDQASTAIVIEMPTSGGKTLLAQFKILQALNQFDAEGGWVAYVSPTRALTAQITRRLRRDFEPINIRVEQLTGAVEIDAFEEDILTKTSEERAFDILVSTPEKLQLVIRNKKVPRPLALVVMDEAQNIEDEARGLRIELLLATIKRDCVTANFLLLMPYVEKAETIAHWLAQDVKAGRSISIGTTPWKPNERIVGMYKAIDDDSEKAGWRLEYETLITTPQTIHLEGKHLVGGIKPLKIARSRLNATLETAAIARIMSERGTSIAIGRTIRDVWSMAREISKACDIFSLIPNEIRLVQDFLKTEISPSFELIEMLARGVAVHHAGLSDEVRTLIEWLAEEDKLRVLCATNTIAQGINFPVSSIFLASRFLPNYNVSKEISVRDFWNLAGRAGRINHDSVGVIGLAKGKDSKAISKYVNNATGELVSRLVTMLNELEKLGKLNELEAVIHSEQWSDFRCYIAHLYNEKKNLEAVLADTDQLLRNTFGYKILSESHNGKNKADQLLVVTKNYARKLAANPGQAELADMTGFSPEGVGKALAGIHQLERKITSTDWMPESLFGENSSISDLYGIMLRIPQLADSLKEIGGKGSKEQYIAEITNAWVAGKSIQEIAKMYFQGDKDETTAITDACKAIYRHLLNTGTWGFSALSRLSGIDFDSLDESERRCINAIPAMIYHGVKSEEAVLMRMNFVPRSIAENLGKIYKLAVGEKNWSDPIRAKKFIKDLDANSWEKAKPKKSYLSGEGYKQIWKILIGETNN